MLHYVRMFIQSRARSERGASAVEYGLLVALIAVAIIAAVSALGGSLTSIFNETCDDIQGKTSAGGTC